MVHGASRLAGVADDGAAETCQAQLGERHRVNRDDLACGRVARQQRAAVALEVPQPARAQERLEVGGQQRAAVAHRRPPAVEHAAGGLVRPHRGGVSEARLPAAATRGPLRTRAGTPARTASLTVVGGFFALLACLVVLGSLAESVRDKEALAMDAFATPFLHGLASPGLDQLMNAATFMGSNFAIPPLFALAVILLAWLHRLREALFLAIASAGSLVLNEVMKLIFQRPRPQLDWAQVLPDYSFPSGHAMNSVAFYVALAVVLWRVRGRRIGLASLAIGIVLSVFIGVSRIYLGYHYLTDVVGGVLAGTIWLLIVAAAFRFGPSSRLGRDAGPDADADADADARTSTGSEEPPVIRR